MTKTKKKKGWEKRYAKLIHEQRRDVYGARHIMRMIRGFIAKKNRLRHEINLYAEENQKKQEYMAKLRDELEKFEQQKIKLPPKQKRLLQRLHNEIHDSLADRILLMEQSEHVRKYHVPKNARATKPKPESKRWMSGFIQEMNRLSTDEAREKSLSAMHQQLAKIRRDERILKRINGKTLEAIRDIRDLDNIIQYLKKNDCDELKIKPLIKNIYWLMPPPKEEEKKATITINKVKLRKRTKLVRQEILDVRPPYILEHIPQLMPTMYDYLD